MSRVLITGLATYWGGRLAQILEADPDTELIVGVDRRDPRVELERTEFVRVKEDYDALRRIVEVAGIDTVLHTDVIVDSTRESGRAIHEQNVIGTMNLLAAAATHGSPVRKMIVKSSSMVYGAGKADPYIFRETNTRTNPHKTRIEKSLLEAEDYVRDFAQDNPHVSVSLFRVSNVVGDDIRTPMLSALRLPVVPAIAGFDPLIQVAHVDDVASAFAFAVHHDLVGVYNIAAEGALPWSEIRKMANKPELPLPPYGTEIAAAALRSARIIDLPPELLAMLRYGRQIDNNLIKAAGLEFRYTCAAAIEDFVEGMRLKRVIGTVEPAYEYQDDVENFLLRHAAHSG